MTAIAHSENFHDWFKSLGGNLISHDYRSTQEKANFRQLQVSTLKIDPQATKEKYNHKFKHNESR